MSKILYCNHEGQDILYSSDKTPNNKLNKDDVLILNPDDPVSRVIVKVVRKNKNSLWVQTKWKDSSLGFLVDSPCSPRKVDGDAFYLITSYQPTK